MNAPADRAIGKTVFPAMVVVTSNVVYTISVTNLGPTSAFGLVVTDPLPANMAFVSAQSSQGACAQADGIVTCALGTMTNTGEATITITAAPLIEGAPANTGSVASVGTDPVPGNNSATAVVSVMDHPAGPILRITKIGTNALIYATTNSAGYVLQSSTNVSAGSPWPGVTNTPGIVGSQYYITNFIALSPKHYRLAK